MTFDNLLESLSKSIGIAIEDAGGAAAIEIDGTTIILQDAGNLLLLRADLGEIQESGREHLIAAAMEANYLYQGTGGSTLAINPEDGHLHIQKYNWIERLDPETTFDMLERFADTINTWRKIVVDFSAVAQKTEDAEEENDAPLGNQGFLRV